MGMTNFVSPNVMKKILLLLSGLAVVPLFTSCADYGVYGATVTRPIVANPGFVGGGFGPGFAGGGLAPLQVGFVSTTFNRWAWDPWRRHWFDLGCNRYFDPRLRRYCNVAPRRFPTAVYPSGYRRGARLACPSYLPRTPVVVNRGGVNTHRGRYAPVVHGTSRGVTPVRGSNFNRTVAPTRGNSGRVYGSSSPVRRTVSPVPSRSRVTPSTVSRNSQLRTVSTYKQPSSTTSRSYSKPTVKSPSSVTTRNLTYGKSQPTRSTSSVKSSGYSRSTSSPSRSVTRARQRTR